MTESVVEGLFSDDPRLREEAASRYRVFPGRVRIPKQFRQDWQQLLGHKSENDGLQWPNQLAQLARPHRWPEYAFGTANAACLLVMHRPGLGSGEESVESLDRVLFIKPRVPVLGGIPHAHNALFPRRYNKSPTWLRIHDYLKPAFEGLKSPWSQLMTCNINTEHGPYGIADEGKNVQGLSILDHIVTLCRPKIIVLCGKKVHAATASWSTDVKTIRVAHPSMWHRSSMSLPNGSRTAAIVRTTLFRR